MFGIGFTELLVIGVLALIILGPERLPQTARVIGQWMAQFRRAATDLKEEMEAEIRKTESLVEGRKITKDGQDDSGARADKEPS
jgi:sec-independent protein translocase protein TatB